LSRDYKIFETVRFSTDLQLLARHRKKFIGEKLLEYVYPQLKREPHCGLNVKRLRGWDPPTGRYRIGDWRFFYVVDQDAKMVSMTAASHRSSAYR
jgi:mRNA interferase RelE/StbE